jgi:hypothetical protein
VSDPRPREQMAPEALALQMETWQGWTRPRRDAAASYLRRLAALEREAEVWAATSSRAEEKIAALERENRLLREEALRHIAAWEGECARLRRVLASLAESPWRASAARRIIREALAGAPDAPDAQEPLPTTYPADASDFPDWQEREVGRLVAQRCAPLVEALRAIEAMHNSPIVRARDAATAALAAHRAQEKAGGAEVDRGE